MHRHITTTTIALMAGAAADAGMISQAGAVPMQSTNWSASISVDQFDDMDGARTLQSVTWSIVGVVEGSAAGESLGAAPQTVTLNLAAEISLSRDGDMLAMASPTATESFDASSFDGLLDFAGDSGAAFDFMEATAPVSGISDDIAPYIGDGQITLDAFASAMSTASAGGNLATQFTTMASMEYEVVYEFLVVPSPGAAALFGLAGLTMWRRRR